MKKFGVLGFPVKHSLSPLMHNAAMKEVGFDGSYEHIEVAPDDLNCFMKRVKTGEFSGLSVTVPYKEAVIEYCDKLSDEAKLIGAVNTLYFDGTDLVGTNTDWYGFIKALEEVEPGFAEKRILVVGAGGAARACLYALNKFGVEPYLTNRSMEKLDEMVNDFDFISVESDLLEDLDFDIVVNATSVGLKEDDPMVVSESLVDMVETVFDLIYLDTKLVVYAREKGKKLASAKRMLLLQGGKQFEYFTGVNPPLEVMWKSIN